MIDLDDARIAKIADVISNKTAKKILSLLAEGELGGGEISTKLNSPLNTITYNLKKLVEAGLVEKVNRIFWSSRGKRIEIYKLTNKNIIISSKKIVRGVLPTMIISGVATLLVKFWVESKLATQKFAVSAGSFAQEGARADAGAGAVSSTALKMAEEVATTNADSVTQVAVNSATQIAQFSWVWFFIGSMFGILIYLFWNWRGK